MSVDLVIRGGTIVDRTGLANPTVQPPEPRQPLTRLKIRTLPFHFGDGTPFQWNPANPFFGFAMNSLSFIAPPFERYIVAAVHEAMPRAVDDG
jgi:predicted metal-dependent hydrolase